MWDISNQKKIAQDLNLSRSTIWNIWIRFLKIGTVNDQRESGRLWLLSEKGLWSLIILTKKSPFYGPFQLVQVKSSTRVCQEILFNDIWKSWSFLEGKLRKNRCLQSRIYKKETDSHDKSRGITYIIGMKTNWERFFEQVRLQNS